MTDTDLKRAASRVTAAARSRGLADLSAAPSGEALLVSYGGAEIATVPPEAAQRLVEALPRYGAAEVSATYRAGIVLAVFTAYDIGRQETTS